MIEWVLSIVCIVLIIYSILYYILVARKRKPIKQWEQETKLMISAGPCQFCDWTLKSTGVKPTLAYNEDHTDVILFCPQCGIELLGQTKIED